MTNSPILSELMQRLINQRAIVAKLEEQLLNAKADARGIEGLIARSVARPIAEAQNVPGVILYNDIAWTYIIRYDTVNPPLLASIEPVLLTKVGK